MKKMTPHDLQMRRTDKAKRLNGLNDGRFDLRRFRRVCYLLAKNTRELDSAMSTDSRRTGAGRVMVRVARDICTHKRHEAILRKGARPRAVNLFN